VIVELKKGENQHAKFCADVKKQIKRKRRRFAIKEN
jgi:hypothetical protein